MQSFQNAKIWYFKKTTPVSRDGFTKHKNDHRFFSYCAENMLKVSYLVFTSFMVSE